MSYDIHDTIAAVASAAGGAARGVVRISGPETVARLVRCFQPSGLGAAALASVSKPQRIAGYLRIRGGGDGDAELNVPGSLLLWPDARSYTRQPAAEFHTIGSPPLLSAIVEELGRLGIRPAKPGEFTLRAFLAGRIDLTQAEGVLGVIDAQRRADLDAALDQVAGGLSQPLHRIREELLGVLAELEAGLDFVEEDIEFISREHLTERIAAARATVDATRSQLSGRDSRNDAPRIVLLGPPNAGKSSLFNALLERFGDGGDASSIVSPQPGATRDYVVGRIRLDGIECELVDTAGIDDLEQDEILRAAQQAAGRQRRAADIRLMCVETGSGDQLATPAINEILIRTKVDLQMERSAEEVWLASRDAIGCSSATGAGLDLLAARICATLGRPEADGERFGAVAATSARCGESLRRAADSLAAASALVALRHDELLAAEIRNGLDALGEIVGAICTDDVLDRVFSQFCIGK